MQRFSVSAAGLAIASIALAGPTIYDFDDLANGEIVGGQYAPDLNISGTNFNRSFDIIAAFDTRLTNTADPDLEGPNWAIGNLSVSNTDLGNVLIIAENNAGATSGFLSSPDDEGQRPGGQIVFSFGSAIGSFGFDLGDIEHVTLGNTILNFSLQGVSVGSVALSAFTDANSSLYDASIAFGDNSANRFRPITSAYLGGVFDEVTLTLGGSGAIDNIVVPTPGALATISLVGLAATGRARRR